MFDDSEELEYVLLNKNEVFVYKIPTRPSLGHRAEDWHECIWKGKLQVTAKGNQCTVKLIEAASGKLFAQSPLPPDYDTACERTVDSSRYFALRLDDGKGKHAFVGMGFESRNDAFDFNCSLADFARRNEVEQNKDSAAFTLDSEKVHRLKDGEKIKMNLKGIKTRRDKGSVNHAASANNNTNVSISSLLPPPPTSMASHSRSTERKYQSSDDLLEL